MSVVYTNKKMRLSEWIDLDGCLRLDVTRITNSLCQNSKPSPSWPNLSLLLKSLFDCETIFLLMTKLCTSPGTVHPPFH